MTPIRLIIFFSVFLFGAYSMHQAKIDVKYLQTKAPRQMKSKELASNKENVSGDRIQFMNRAFELSFIALSDNHEYPVGSVLVKDGRIIGEGWTKTALLNDPSAHAELEAIRNASKTLATSKLKGAAMYVSAQPCAMCLSLMYLTEVDKVYYCIPGYKMDSMNFKLPVTNFHEGVSKLSWRRSVTEIPIMQDEVDKLLIRYKQIN